MTKTMKNHKNSNQNKNSKNNHLTKNRSHNHYISKSSNHIKKVMKSTLKAIVLLR